MVPVQSCPVPMLRSHGPVGSALGSAGLTVPTALYTVIKEAYILKSEAVEIPFSCCPCEGGPCAHQKAPILISRPTSCSAQ
jgi:hypothetical protein